MIIAADINVEYIMSFEYYIYLIRIGFTQLKVSLDLSSVNIDGLEEYLLQLQNPLTFLQLQISMFKCKWGICAKVDR